MNNPTLARTIGADYAGLVSLFTRRLHDTELAEDLVHQAFVESLDKLQRGRITDTSRFSGFVYAVALNLLRNHRRRMDNRVSIRAAEGTLETLPSDTLLFEQLRREALAQQVRTAVDELSVTRDRDVLQLFYLQEESKADVCRRFGLEPLHFDKILFRARRRMRNLLLERGIQAEDALCDAEC